MPQAVRERARADTAELKDLEVIELGRVNVYIEHSVHSAGGRCERAGGAMDMTLKLSSSGTISSTKCFGDLLSAVTPHGESVG